MARWIRSFLQLLILALGGFLLWRYWALPWTNLALIAAFLGGLFLMASVLGSRLVQPDYAWADCTEKFSVAIAVIGIGWPLVAWSFLPLLLLLFWWGFLMAYLSHPAGSDMQPARQYFLNLGSRPTGISAWLRQAAFLVAFWPIFVPKAIYFWGLLLLGTAWLLKGVWSQQS